MTAPKKLDPLKQEAVVERIVQAHPEGITRRKLRVMLFLIDREAYAELGRSITGAVYRRGVHAPRVEGLSRTIRALRSKGHIR